MGLVQRAINKCDVCGHEWIPKGPSERCGNRKCRSTKWNSAAKPLIPLRYAPGDEDDPLADPLERTIDYQG